MNIHEYDGRTFYDKNHYGSDLLSIYRGPDYPVPVDEEAYTTFPFRNPEVRAAIGSAALAVLPHAAEYAAVIGEDRSGRLPACIIGGAIADIRREAGLEPLRRYFVSGRVDMGVKPRWRLGKGSRKSLVVTEYIMTGGSTRNVANVLAEMRQPTPDFAVLGGTLGRTAQLTDRAISREDGVRVFTATADIPTYSIDQSLTTSYSSRWPHMAYLYKERGRAHPTRRELSPDSRADYVSMKQEAHRLRREIVTRYLEDSSAAAE